MRIPGRGIANRALIALFLLAMTGCASLRPSSGSEIDHVVVIWLKDHGNAQQQQQMIDRSKRFTQIPGVLSVSVGTCLPSTRPVVDTSYDVAVVMRFANEQALHQYDQHPIHKKAVQELLAPLAAKIVIYDFRVK
jgi:hypothetical protein